MTTTNLLNTAFIKRRRVELGLSNRVLAAAVGITSSGLLAFEEDASQGDITLAMLERLSTALACDVRDLIATPEADEPDRDEEHGDEGDVERDPAADAAALGMVLYASSTLTPVAALAEITGWTRRHVKATLDVLEERLAVAGLALHRLENRVAVRGAGDVDGDLVATAVRAHLNRDGLNLTEMRLLRRILDGDTPPQPTNSEQVALGVLANARLIEPDGPGGWKATDEVTFSVSAPP